MSDPKVNFANAAVLATALTVGTAVAAPNSPAIKEATVPATTVVIPDVVGAGPLRPDGNPGDGTLTSTISPSNRFRGQYLIETVTTQTGSPPKTQVISCADVRQYQNSYLASDFSYAVEHPTDPQAQAVVALNKAQGQACGLTVPELKR